MQSLLSGFEDYTGSVLDDPKQATEAAAGAVDAGRHALGRKQAADMEAFFAPFVLGDERLLMDLCRDYEPYTVETLLHVPLDSDAYFKLEVEEDGYLSGLRGFNAWDVIGKSRRTLAGDQNAEKVFHRRSWPTDVAQYLEAVVPAERVAEVATLVESFFSVADLLLMADEHHLQILKKS